MIFKTFNNDIDKTSAKIGVLGKSFYDFKEIIQKRNQQITTLKKDNISDKDAKAQVGSLWSNLFSSKSLMKDVDAAIPELKTATAKEELTNLQKLQKKINNKKNRGSWDDYKDNFKGKEYLLDYAKEHDVLKASVDDVKKANQDARKAVIAQNAALKNQSLSAKAGQMALQGLAAAGNMLLMWGISKAIEGIVYLSEKEERAAENAKSMAVSLQNFSASFGEGSQKVNELSKKYEELSQGVSTMGENISLTDDQYAEYKSTISELSELMPNLNMLFNEQGEKIGFVGGKLKDTAKEYERYIKTQAQDYLRNGNEDGNTIQDILDDFDYSNASETYGWSELWRDGVNFLINGLTAGGIQDPDGKIDYGSEFFGATPEYSENEQLGILQSLVNKRKDQWSDILNDGSLGDSKEANLVEELLGIDVDKVATMKPQEYNQLQQSLEQKIKGLQQTLEGKAYNISSSMQTMLFGDDDYWDIQDDTVRNALSSIISGLNYDALTGLDIDLSDQLSVETWVAGMVDTIKSDKTVSDAFKGLFSLDIDTLNPQEAENAVDKYMKTIADAMYGGNATDEQMAALKKSYGFEIDTELVSSVEEKLQKKYKDKAKELTLGQLKIASEIEVPEGDQLSWEELLEKIKEVQGTLNEPLSLDDFKTASETLSSVSNAFKEMSDNGYLSLSTLSSIKTAVGSSIPDWDAFQQKLMNAEAGSAEFNQAMGQLTYAVLENQLGLKGLAGADEQYIAAILKENGLLNANAIAHEMVQQAQARQEIQSRLTTGATEENVTALINNAASCGIAQNAYLELLANEIAFGNNTLNVEDKINRLNQIAAAANIAGLEIQSLNNDLNGKQKKERAAQLGISVNDHTGKMTKDKNGKVVPDWEYTYNGQTYTKFSDAEIAAESDRFMKQLESSYADIDSSKYDYTKNTSTQSEKEESTSTQNKEETKETFNWIETAINRIERLVSRLRLKADSAYKSWTSRNDNLRGEISAVRNEIELQQRAYEQYMQKAASVGLPESWAEKVRNGQIDIETISNENLSEKIKEYQEWYEKALDCQDAIEELNETVSDLYKNAFDNVSKQYDNVLSAIEHQKSMLDEYISQADQNDYSTFDQNHSSLVKSIDLYKNLLAQEQQNISQLKQEKASLLSSFYEAMGSGAITEGSEAWAEMRDKINEVTLAIESSNTEVLEYHKSIGELFETAFDNISKQYDNILSGIEHRKNMLDAAISQTEEKGWLISVEYYKALMNTELDNLNQLQKKRDALNSSLTAAVNSGEIREYSQAWYDMRGQIDDVTQAIEEANTAMIQYGNSIRDIKWEIFDLLQERISGITSESDFLLDLLENDTLYDKDSGQLTNEGMAAMGLHGLNYDIYMAQSEKYAQEMLDIDKQLANDPYNQTLAKRRQELLELQRESILAAESEKQAIKDMVEEGIKLELDSLKELINTYTDALDSQKELYDYQKKVSKQTEEIAALQKRLSAYENDDSEEAKAKVQQWKVSLEEKQDELEETEYEKYIADQKQLLDDLYLEYELVLNQRLDNLDALLADMIDRINENAATISTTLSDTASSVGTTLSESMRGIWDTSTGTITQVLAAYGENILTSNNNVNSTLSGMNQNLQNMVTQLNTLAEMKIQSVAASAAAVSSPVVGLASAVSSPVVGLVGGSSAASPSPAPASPGGSASGWGSWFIPKSDSYPKDKLKKDSSIVDRLKWFNYDSSKEARGSYFAAMGGSGNYTGSKAQNVWMLDQMKAHGYSQGGYIADLQRTAYRNGDDMITVNTLKRGEAVLTPAQAEQFERLLGKLDTAELALNLPNALAQLPQNLASGHNGPIKNEIQMEVVLPNVQSYEDFKYAMQHDKNFEKMVQAMTVGRAAGGSSLKKYQC